ncbi:MAG: TonB-dependent receptor [Bacteroidales bacterium]|jgi:iron complex outermembrane receptor protein|nr:TonB-dependent receptor [Bacteroidales bacterium]
MKEKEKFKTARSLSGYRRMAWAIALVASFSMTTAFAQLTVKGKILDETGETVIGVNILEKGTVNGTASDTDGNYSITVQDGQRAVLLFSYVGYNTIEEDVNGRSEINIALESSVVNLGEVVAIGYGTQTRRQITGSVANISEENFNKGISRDAADLLQGKVAGLTVTSGSGDVTRGSQIRLRGTSTLQNDQGPMIVIDGIPGGDISTVAPSDIESISVLKDASSQAIYGSRAAGGVILITTKRGSGMKLQVTYDGYASADFVANKPHLLSAAEWRDVNNQLGKDVSSLDRYGAETDWLGEMLRTGFSQNHAVSLSGGGSNNNYRASYTYMDRNGIARDNYITRHSFRFQFQQRAINNRLRIDLTGSASLSDMQFPFRDDFILAYNLPPVYPVKVDGEWFTDMFGKYDQGNPVQNQDENYNLRKHNYFYGAGNVLFDIMEGLNAKVHLYKSAFSGDRSQWLAPTNSRGRGTNGQAEREASTMERDLIEWTFNYNKEFNKKHSVDAIAGYSWEINTYQNQYSRATDFAVTSMGANNIQSGNTLKVGEVTSSKNEYKLISFFGRVHYGYAGKYMATATVRRDGSSKFGANHKWGLFPSVSAAWGVTQEDFLKEISWINDLKLRAGYGVTGNQDGLQPYKTLELYESYGTYYNNESESIAYRISQNANPNLKWEETAMLNIGLDFSLFNGRLGGTIEWYDKRTTDMIYRYAVPTPTFVYDRIYANVGDMLNTGIELLLNVDVVRGKEFNYKTSVNLAHNRNEIIRLSNDLYTTDRIYTGDPWIRGGSGVTSHVIEEGRPVGQFFMLKAKSNQLTADGKFEFEDINNDGQITDDDRTYVGSAQPDLTFGWNNTFSYKNWDASFFIRGTVGNKVLNNPIAAYGNNTYVDGANAIMNDNLLKYKENSRVSSFYLEDASFARLDNMAIGYTFNTSKVNWLDRARIYVATQNLFVITGYTGLDPEVELFRGNATDDDAGLSPGIEARNYFPKARSITFGVNLTF